MEDLAIGADGRRGNMANSGAFEGSDCLTYLNGPAVAAERPYLLVTLAAIGALGCAAVIIGMFVAQASVPNHDWIADTISDLGAGEWEIVMDVALYGVLPSHPA